MLTAYLAQLQALLQLPTAPSNLYTQANLTTWINIARGQVAGEGECIRYLGTISTVVGQQSYGFSGISLGASASNGIQGALKVENIQYVVASGQKWVNPRPWPWFQFYELNNPVPVPGPPRSWSQYQQGSAPGLTGSGGGGSFYVSPPPDIVYQLNADCVCYPNALAADSDVEAIPYLWTDCVPFFAAYFALLSAQNNARVADAQRYYGMYQTFLTRARQAANPSTNRWQSQQAVDPVQAAKLGVKQAAGGGG